MRNNVPVHAGEDIAAWIAASHRTRLGAVPRERVVEETVKTYHVAYERDESGWWVASVRELRGCHTQGRTVDEARRRVREAMRLFIDDARTAKIVDDIRLPADAKRAITAYSKLRKKAEQEDRRAAAAARRAVRLLRGGRLKMSARDAAQFLGLSHQRIHQLAHERSNRG
jgi:predicted RNase H-like HicB family nuclease